MRESDDRPAVGPEEWVRELARIGLSREASLWIYRAMTEPRPLGRND